MAPVVSDQPPAAAPPAWPPEFAGIESIPGDVIGVAYERIAAAGHVITGMHLVEYTNEGMGTWVVDFVLVDPRAKKRYRMRIAFGAMEHVERAFEKHKLPGTEKLEARPIKPNPDDEVN